MNIGLNRWKKSYVNIMINIEKLIMQLINKISKCTILVIAT